MTTSLCNNNGQFNNRTNQHQNKKAKVEVEEVPLDITILIGAKKKDPMDLISINN
jgi:hypothetical protein